MGVGSTGKVADEDSSFQVTVTATVLELRHDSLT